MYSTHTGLNRAEGAEKMMTELREEGALRLEWQDHEAQNGAATASGKDSEEIPCRMQEGVAPRHLGFCPLVPILASKT